MKKYIFLILTVLLTNISVFSQDSAYVKNSVLEIKPSVVDFREEGLMGRFVGDIIQLATPLDLKVGDIFVDLDGVAKKVVRIETMDGEVFIDTIQPDMSEVIDYLDIPVQTLSFTNNNLTQESLQYVEPDSRASFSANISKKIYENEKKKLEVSIGAGINTQVDLSIGCQLPWLEKYGKWWQFWKIREKPGYASADIKYDVNLNGFVEFKLGGSLDSPKLPIAAYGAPTPGVSASVGLYGQITLEGAITVKPSLAVGIKGNGGARCTLSGIGPLAYPHNFTSYSSREYYVNLGLEVSAEACLKLKIFLGGDISILGFTLFDAQFGGGPYIKLSGSVSASIGYSSKTGFTKSIEASASGELGIFFYGEAKFFKGKVGVTFFNIEIPLYKFLDKSWSTYGESIYGIPSNDYYDVPALRLLDNGLNSDTTSFSYN